MDRESLVKSLRDWQNHLEMKVGATGIALAVGCASIPNDYLALFFVVVALYTCFKAIDLGAHQFPEDLLELRTKLCKTKREVVEHDYAELQLQKMKTPLLYMGILSLLMVATKNYVSILSII
ncbi:hypothetical protein [Marinobacter sp. SS8-8]|uniref:hypothetical protein n=1 Tax=Marinobacter sp. SS8-8 TaxID=3050452 RepID=UPI0026DFAF79|nr:hypothetical protein [Marinobacter sp. SS8-8]